MKKTIFNHCIVFFIFETCSKLSVRFDRKYHYFTVNFLYSLVPIWWKLILTLELALYIVPIF